ncbi:hypothetical protein QYE76_048320 [Lolium multiflorum]|uniref:Transposase (putative) gypsy type domain-containing protein n=1 Tax=Lolium multiflorum TaxID=4521 RepID=A0AAD8Q2F9_LOLMU|nr:hypothetical protein QYE76_048320 [Lolium multiflorum]
MVITKALVERGFSFPPSDFLSEILKAYGLQPHNISPNSILAISNHVTLCEGHLWDVSDPASDRKLPEFKNSPASETPAWTQCPHLSESPQLTRAVRRICKLTEEGLSGKDLTMSWFTKRIQPLQHRDRLMFHYTGRDDPMRATKDNLSADAIDKRIRLLIKVPRELHVHVCNIDIHSDGSGTAPSRKASSELSSGFLTRGTTIRKPHLRRKFPMLRVPPRGRRPPPPALQPNVPARRPASRLPQKLRKPSPPDRQEECQAVSGIYPVTPEVEVPPKASSAAKSDPKDVINVDDLPEDPINKGDSGKGASSSAPPPEQPTATSTDIPADKAERKLLLSGATGTPQTHPHFFPTLEKISLSQRHAEVSKMMEQVWGPANTEEKELIELEGGIKAFFAKHKNVRQHEDLRTHILEQRQEIDLLQSRDADNQKAIALLETRIKSFEDDIAKRPSIDSLSAKIEVLQAENESLKKFLKESSEEETKKRRELLEKHTQELSDLAEKLKKSHQRIQTLAAKNKKYEEEAEAIDKMIFHKDLSSLGFEWTKETALKRTEAYEEVQSSIDNLFEACRGVAKSLSLKRAGTAVIDTMTKLIKQVPELIKDWQESSARGVASLVLATCKAHFPTLNFADVSRGTPKSANMRALLAETQGYDRLFVGRVNHSFWYNKHDLPAGFSDAEDEDKEDLPGDDYAEEGSGSSADHDEEGFGDDSGDGSGDGSTYIASDEDQSSE